MFTSSRILGVTLLAMGSLATENHHEHYQEITLTNTVYATTTVPVTCYENVTVPHYIDVTIPHYVDTTYVSTVTKIVSAYVTELTTTTLHYSTAVTETETDSTSITNTLHYTTAVTETETDSTSITNTLLYTVSVTETDLATVTNTETDLATVTNTETDSTTVTNTETDTATITNTETETITTTLPATITTWTTQTLFSTTYDPCPKYCSISAATVNLYFWPTNRPYTYPSTYVDLNLGYTFISPSVYMMIPTAAGVNTAGSTVGPSTSSWILPLDLEEVSTIDGSITRQLTLSDLRTDCPKTAEPSAIAAMLDSACDPILAAPRQVRSWANPCNACGRFGLFDPPYAVPPVTGLIGSTVVGTITTGVITTSVVLPSSGPTAVPVDPSTEVPISSVESVPVATSVASVPTATSEPAAPSSSSPVTAAGSKLAGGVVSMGLAVLAGLLVL